MRVIAAFVARHGYWASDRSLALYRILFSLGVLLMVTPSGTLALAGIPDSMYHPPLGPMMLFSGWPDRDVLLLLELAVQLLLVCVLFGAWTRQASIGLALAGGLLAGFRYSAGKIDHELVIVVAVPLLMAFTSWGHRWSVDARRAVVRASKDFRAPATNALFALALTIGASYFTSGFAKGLTGWLDPSGGATRSWLLTYLHQYRWAPNEVNTLIAQIDSTLLWNLIDAASVVLEAGVLVAALRRRWFVRYLLLLVGFHLSVYALFSINFSRLLLVYLAFIHLDRLATWLRLDAIDRIRTPVLAGALGVTAVGIGWGYLADEEPVRLLRSLGRHVPVSNAIWIPGVVVAGILIREVVIAVRRRRSGERLSLPPTVDTRTPAVPDSRVATTVAGTVGGILVAQLALMFTVAEPYPAPTGPLFMGNRATPDGVVVFQQYMAVEVDGERNSTRAVHVLPVESGYVTNLRQVRFPMPDVDPDGQLVDPDAAMITRLPLMGHRFSSDHLPGYDGPLDEEAAAWVRGGLEGAGIECTDDCNLVVAWIREYLDPTTGEVIEGSRELLERRRWDLVP